MSVLSLPLRLTGARVLGDTGFQDRPLTIADGRISEGPAPEIDFSGYDILPGIVDLHALLPRNRFAAMSHAIEHDLAGHGITTAWLVQDWSWQGAECSPDHAERFLGWLAALRGDMRADLRPLLRCDTHMMDEEDRLLAALRRHAVDSVLFVDRLSWHGPPADPALHARAEALRERGGEVHRHLCNLAHAFDVLEVRSGSYGDRDGQCRERLAMMGAKICAAPAGVGAAAVARAWGDPVLMPARSVLEEPDIPGAPDARDMITGGMCDALISDGAPGALHRAALHLAETGILPLPGAWSLVSSRPARIMGLTDRGGLWPGQRADLVVLYRARGRIAATMSAGHWTWRNPDVPPPNRAGLQAWDGQGINTPLRSTAMPSVPRSS